MVVPGSEAASCLGQFFANMDGQGNLLSGFPPAKPGLTMLPRALVQSEGWES